MRPIAAAMSPVMAGRISMNRCGQRPVSALPPSPKNDIVAVFIGLAVYALFVLFLQGWLIGVPAMA